MSKNNKKKALCLALGLAGVMTLSGCNNSNENKEVKYSYETLEDAKFIHLTNEIKGTDEYYIVRYGMIANGDDVYVDLLSDETIYMISRRSGFVPLEYDDYEIEVLVDDMYDYLYRYDMVLDSYSTSDLEELKVDLVNDIEFINELQLKKVK